MNPGDLISRYRILSRIGRGGMGVVYRAQDTRLDREVALKFLPSDGFTEQSKTRFLNEARAAAKARHPNICPVYDVEEADGELFLVMACLDGETLQQRIARGPLEPAQAIDVAIQAARGLAAAHAQGIVHRDIKSSNVMVDPSGHASILDFGLALIPDATRLTQAGSSVGTPAYMSPEQIAGKPVDARTDVWSLGVVLFEMLTGALPFRRDQSVAVLHAILEDPVPALNLSRAQALQPIIEKALAKDPANRWQSMAEFETALRRFSAGEAPADTVTRTIVTPSLPTDRKRRRGWLIPVGILALLVLNGRIHVPWFNKAERSVAPAARQVAVLPFEADAATQSVADGLTEILAAALGGFDKTVAGIGPVELRASKATTVEEARRMFGANLVLTGTARPDADQVRFTVHLIDAASKADRGERSFLYDPKDPLTSRDRAVKEVASLLDLDVSPAVRTLVSTGDTGTPDAYSAYLKGRGFLARHDLPGNTDRAIDAFSAAARQDPRYALALAGLGEAYWRKAYDTGDKHWSEMALQHAERAIAVDPNLAAGHTVLGYIHHDAGRNEDAVRELKRAMELAPTNPEAPRKLAEIYKSAGRFDEAENLYVQSTQLRPTDWYGYLLLGVFYYERERYEEAEAALNHAKTLAPDNDMVREDLAGIYRMHGRYKDAISEYQQALRIRSSAFSYAGLGGAYYYEHRFQEAVTAVEAAIDLDSSEYRYWGNLGIYCRWAPGNEAKSAPALRRALELALKRAGTTKSDYSLLANIAEYRARLGDGKAALATIDSIPVSARGPLTTRLAIVYELTGHRDQAIAIVRENLKKPASRNQIKDDPDLAALYNATAN